MKFRPACLGAFALFAIASQASAFETGHILVANRGASNVLEFDSQLNFVKTWFDGEGLSVPNGMAMDPAGNVYMADTGNDRIVVFGPTGAKITEWSTLATLSNSVESLNFGPGGRLYASANPGNGVVVSYKTDGTDVQTLVTGAAFQNLGNVNTSVSGNLLISDFSGSRGMRELDQSGAVLQEFGQGTSKHEDATIDADDNIFVSGFDGNSILRFDAARGASRHVPTRRAGQPDRYRADRRLPFGRRVVWDG